MTQGRLIVKKSEKNVTVTPNIIQNYTMKQ